MAQELQGFRELRTEHHKLTSKVLFQMLAEKGVAVRGLINVVKEKYGVELNSGNISGYKSGTGYIPPILVWEACQLAGISVDKLLLRVEQEFRGREVHCLENKDDSTLFPLECRDINIAFPDSASFVTDPTSAAFRGYLGSYYIYFTPTYSSGEGFIKGILTLKEGASIVKAKVELLAHSKGKEETSVNKLYEGTLIYSNSLNCFYCILSSADVGELCFLMFRQMHLYASSLECRLAEVLTTSAGGEDKNPTTHRMLISREEVSDEDVLALLPLLNLNCSVITVSKEALEQVASSNPKFGEVINHVLSTPGMRVTEYYQIRENTIRAEMHDLDSNLEVPLVVALRARELSSRYNKVSKKADDNIRNYLIGKGYFKEKISKN